MAINFYDDISLDGQQLKDASIDIVASQPAAGASYQGRIIFNQNTSALEYYTGSAWISLDGTGNIDSIAAGIGLRKTGTTADPVIEVGYGGSGVNNIITDATGSGSLTTSSRILVSNGNSVVDYPISSITTLLNSGVSTVVTTDTTFIDMTPTGTAVDGAVTITAALSATGTPSSTTYLRGNNSWHTPPTNTNTEYTLPASGGATAKIRLIDDGNTTINTINLLGTANQITSTESGGDTITYSLPTSITTPGSVTTGGSISVGTALAVSGTTSLTGSLSVTAGATFTTIPTIPISTPSNPTDAASKSYVDSVVSGGLIFQGGYDATNAAPSTGVLQGWTYAITVGGSGTGGYWNPALEEGDLIIAESDTPTTQADWTILQNNVVLATNATAGIAMFKTANGFGGSMTAGQPVLAPQTPYSGGTLASQVPVITTSAFGTVTLITNTNILIDSTAVSDFSSAAQTQINLNSDSATITGDGSATTFAVTHSLGLNVAVQVYLAVGRATVYPRIERSSPTNVNVIFKTAPANAVAFKVLLF